MGVPTLSLTEAQAAALSGFLSRAPLGGFGFAGFKLTIDTGVFVGPALSANRDDLSFLPGEAAVAIGPGGEVLLSTTAGYVQLVGVTQIQLSDATDTISGNVVTQTYADGSKDVSTFNIAGRPFTQKVLSYGADGKIDGKTYAGVTADGDPYEDKYLYAGGTLIGARDYEFSDVAGPSRSAYYYQEIDTDGAGRTTRATFANIVGAPYSAYEYDYVGGVFSGSKLRGRTGTRRARLRSATAASAI